MAITLWAEANMFPLAKWHAVWLAAAVLVSVVAAGALLARHSGPAGPVTMTMAAAPTPVTNATADRPARAGRSASGGAPIYVHVSGQVARPGLYRMAPGARVLDAVTGAGGATGDADLDALNLATPLYDGQKLVVPGFGEPPPSSDPGYIVDSPPPPVAVLVRPDPVVDEMPGDIPYAAPMPAASMDVAGPGAPAASVSPATSGASSRPPSSSLGKLRVAGEGVVNINTASLDGLQRLPGVGPATARKILDYRSAHGGFRTVEELMEVKGIGEKKLEKMAPFVVL